MIHASRAIGDEPAYFSQMDRTAVDAMTARTLERILGLGVATEKELKLVQEELLEEAETPFYLQGARGERARIDSFLEAVQNRNLSLGEFNEVINGHFRRPGGQLQSLREDLQVVQIYLAVPARRAQLLDLMTYLVEAGRSSEPAQAAVMREADERIRVLGDIPIWQIRNLISLIRYLGEADLRTKVFLRSAAAGVAAERFRLAHHRWPEGWQELVPAYLPAVLNDPFDGAPLRWRRLPGKLAVYSIGPDLDDDGGALTQAKPRAGIDIGFILHDPDKRRQTDRLPDRTRSP
jgi:hypothetical protein